MSEEGDAFKGSGLFRASQKSGVKGRGRDEQGFQGSFSNAANPASSHADVDAMFEYPQQFDGSGLLMQPHSIFRQVRAPGPVSEVMSGCCLGVVGFGSLESI